MQKENPEQRLTHARYEYDMARRCIQDLQQPQEQFQWNVLLAAFAVYWRNCQKFLNGDDDQNSIKAKNYIKRFSPSSASHLKDEIDHLHWHVLHLSGMRTTDDEKKIALKDAVKLMEWLEPNMEKFAGELAEPHKTQWTQPQSEPRGPGSSDHPTTGPTGASWARSATNAILVQTNQTASVSPVPFTGSKKP